MARFGKSQTWVQDLEQDDRELYSSILVLTGPKSIILSEEMELPKLKEMFDKVLTFFIPDDYGEFPDTSGYTAENWEELESELEDPALFRYTQKALDAVVEFNEKRMKQMDKRGYTEIEGFLHVPKFGNRVFAVGGFVRGYSPKLIMTPSQYLRSQVIH